MPRKKSKNGLFVGILLVIVLIAVVISIAFNSEESVNTGESALEGGIMQAADGTKYIVDPALIRGGGPRKGGIGIDRGIPALAEENIKFVSVSEADAWIEDNELVLVLEWKGAKRVYPLQIMVWHEIANDVIAGDNIIVTYCPLCGSGIAYISEIEVNSERVVSRFGTSGKLYNSNLIMYDEETDTYWQQIDGKAIVGELTGQELQEISVDTVTWREWKAAHPDSEVLSQDTGIRRNYGNDPYGSYYEDSFLIFPVDNEDNRIHAKTPIVGIEVQGAYKAYRKEDVKSAESIEDEVNGVRIEVRALEDGRVVITNLDSSEEIVKEEDFWFAWYAFHPETELYGF